jgi:hypothetical protein
MSDSLLEKNTELGSRDFQSVPTISRTMTYGRPKSLGSLKNRGDRGPARDALRRPRLSSVNGILAILDCDECALAVVEGNWDSVKEFAGFGVPTAPKMNPEDSARCQTAVKIVKQLGVPRSWGPEWRLG